MHFPQMAPNSKAVRGPALQANISLALTATSAGLRSYNAPLLLWTLKKFTVAYFLLLNLSSLPPGQCEAWKSVLSTRQNREEEPTQNVFSSVLPGEPGLDFDMCWRCGVQSKPLNYFFGTSKKTLHIKGDLIPALCVAGIVKHFA